MVLLFYLSHATGSELAARGRLRHVVFTFRDSLVPDSPRSSARQAPQNLKGWTRGMNNNPVTILATIAAGVEMRLLVSRCHECEFTRDLPHALQ
jgi:hypothetical protein